MMAYLLFRRDSPGLKPCKTPGLNRNQDPNAGLFVDGITFETFAAIFAGVCGILVFISSGIQMMTHALRYSKPGEQKQIIRIISMIPFFALISFGTTFLERHNAQYLRVILDLYEAFIFASFYLLVCWWIADGREREASLVDKELSRESSPEAQADSSADKPPYGVPRLYSVGVFQFPLTMIFVTIATVVTNYEGYYCVASNDPQYAHIWIGLVQGLSTTIAFSTLAWLGHKSKNHVVEHGFKLKFITFKSIVLILFIQDLFFSYYTSQDTISTTSVLSRTDISVRVPAVVLACEMVLYSLFYHYVFSYREFRLPKVNPEPLAEEGQEGIAQEKPTTYQGGTCGIRALWQAAFASDLVYGAFAVPGRLVQGIRVWRRNKKSSK